ncbi:hypothetical protein ACFWIJ_01925 [Streptomyces sp. NPDC127079]|uniref:hypothetical protein n=1 Tax=Streptomyces sp. NPDC127079 TaxID=3347132 RepID=UPI0036629AAC
MNIILTSGVALGTHVPGLLVNNSFAARGLASRVYVLEQLFPEDVKQRVRAAKGRYSRNFRLAKAAHALAADHAELIPPEAIVALFEEWDAGRASSIAVFSGFWASIVREYVKERPSVRVDVCHLDAVPSPSHRRAGEIPGSRHSWLLNARTNSLNEKIPLGGDSTQIPWVSRSIGFLAHGGGWGMGIHEAAAQELAEAGESVSLILTEPRNEPPGKPTVYLQDPEWESWADAGFPRLVAEAGPDATSFLSRDRWSDAFELTRRARAVVSKPGAGTLVDSLNAATPVLFTEALGEWEVANERIWCALGFGMRLSEWMDKRDPAMLAAMHERLRETSHGITSYPDRLVAEGFGQ